MKVLFELRDHPEYKVFDATNAGLEKYDPSYFARYGRAGSAQWWANYDQGHLTRTDVVGRIAYIGPDEDEPEAGEIVRIETDRREIAYNREDFWLDPAIAVGRWVHVERVKTSVHTRTGPLTAIIDVRVWVEDEQERGSLEGSLT